MGPEGGSRGGMVVAEGTPEEVAAVPESYTGTFLAPILEGREREAARRAAATEGRGREVGPGVEDDQEGAGEEDDAAKTTAKTAKTAAKKAPARKAAAKKSS